jgi:hypothetical protein
LDPRSDRLRLEVRALVAAATHLTSLENWLSGWFTKAGATAGGSEDKTVGDMLPHLELALETQRDEVEAGVAELLERAKAIAPAVQAMLAVVEQPIGQIERPADGGV